MTGPVLTPEDLAHGSELNAVYAIARVVAETSNTEAGLDAVFRLARTIFIIDVVSLYLVGEESGQLEPAYARALGRGRSQEAEIAWGEAAAQEAYQRQQTVLRHEDAGPGVKTRDRRRDFLGLPVLVAGRCLGGLVFGRFGGPPYPPEHVQLAEFVAWHVGQLLENRRTARRIATLEARRELARLQDQFMSTISHELRTPLGAIKGYVTTMLRDDVEWGNEQRREFLQITNDETDRLQRLIDDMLDASRLESGELKMHPAPTRLSDLAQSIASRCPRIYKGMDLAVEVEDHIPPLEIDAGRIERVIENMLSNAYRYAPGAKVTLRALRQEDHVRVEVQDNGPGLPPEHVPHLFNHFSFAPDVRGIVRGTGLGLYISRKIVEAHGGEIGVRTKLDRGSCFYFTLPIRSQEGSLEGG